ncbi:hypothetical protein Tco_0007929 [Tanacetum coccineum]
MEGIKMTKQEHESMLYEEFDKFTSEPGESIHSYYLRFSKLINDMNMISMTMTHMQINTKFVNHLQPEWSSLKETNDCEDLQLQATSNFKADHVDAYDSDCDDEATTNAIFMANLSLFDSLKDDTVEPRYDSDIHFEVPHYDTYHDSDMLNSNIKSWDILKTLNDEDNYVPPPIQKNDMKLSIIEQMKSQVEKYNMVNQELKSVNESLTSELERYQDRVRVLKIQKIEDENVSLAFQVSSLVKEREHIKLEYKKLVNTKLSRPPTSGNKLYSVTSLPKSKVIPKVVEKNDLSKSVTSHLTTNKIIEKCTKVLAPGLLKSEPKPINAYFKNNRDVHGDYLKVPREHVATLHELLKEARALIPLDKNIGHASKFAERIQELLVYVLNGFPLVRASIEYYSEQVLYSTMTIELCAVPHYIPPGPSLPPYNISPPAVPPPRAS